MVEKVQGKQAAAEAEQSTASVEKYQESVNAKFKKIDIYTYDANGNGVIDQSELEKAMDDFKSNAARYAPNAKFEAFSKGYKATANPNFYYDDKNKKHYMIDTNGNLLEAKDVSWVGKDGSYAKRTKGKNGTQKYVGYDKNSYPKEMRAFDTSGKNPVGKAKDAAAGLGLRTTLATDSQGVYYDESTKIHYQWNDKTHSFKAMKGVGMIAADGTTFDKSGKNGNKILHKDGTVETKYSNYTETNKYNKQGKIESNTTTFSDGTKGVQETNKFGQRINYDIDVNGKSNKNELYTFYPDGHVKTEVFYCDGNKHLTTYRQNGTEASCKSTDSFGNLIGLRRTNANGKLTYDYSAQYTEGYNGKQELVKSYEVKYDSQGNFLGRTEKYLSASDGMFTTRYDSKGRITYLHRDYGDLSSTDTYTYKDGKNNTYLQRDKNGNVGYLKVIDNGHCNFEMEYLTKEEYDALQK